MNFMNNTQAIYLLTKRIGDKKATDEIDIRNPTSLHLLLT